MVSNRTENKYRLLFGRAIQRQVLPVLRLLSTQPPDVVAMQSDGLISPEPLERVFRQMIREVGAAESFKTRKKLLRVKAVEPGWVEYFEQFILPAMMRRADIKIAKITETTQKLVKGYIQQSIDDGLGVENIARQVRQVMAETTAARARMIAQTEVISTSNTAAYEGAEQSGIEYMKFWSNSGLEGIRESHIFAQQWSYDRDGVKPDEPFDMGNGNFMMHPGDPDGPAEEVIGCRCTLIVEPV